MVGVVRATNVYITSETSISIADWRARSKLFGLVVEDTPNCAKQKTSGHSFTPNALPTKGADEGSFFVGEKFALVWGLAPF